jgi:hypothetical protein
MLLAKDKIKLVLNNPPIEKVEIVSEFQIYLIKDNGKRGRRICGGKREFLPTSFPENLPNKYGVVNPREEYLCQSFAGRGTDHIGVGPCFQHETKKSKVIGKDGTKMKDLFADIDDIEKVSDEDLLDTEPLDPKELLQLGDFEFYLDEAKSRVSPDELLDIVRPLYELEALKLMTIAFMKKKGFKASSIEAIARRIQESAEVQLTLAKRDHEIIKNKAIVTVIKTMVIGMLSIIDEELIDKAIAREIARRFNDEMIQPTQKIGITEVLKRQESSGMLDRVAMIVNSPPNDENESPYYSVDDGDKPPAGKFVYLDKDKDNA